MNNLLCHHEFDFSIQLPSSPACVRCIHCRTQATVDDAKEYMNKKYPIATEASDALKLELREFWKTAYIASLQGKLYLMRCDNSYAETAKDQANRAVDNYLNYIVRGTK